MSNLEEWREVFKDYEVSSFGKVRSKKRVVIRSNGRPHLIGERILRQAIWNGYHKVGVTINGKNCTKSVHRLVADAFLEKRIGKNEVNHIDGNKGNNSVSNLEWCNRSENVLHAFKTGLSVSLVGENNSSSKIDSMQALTIKTMHQAGFGSSEISKKYGISLNICKDIKRGKTWKWLLKKP